MNIIFRGDIKTGMLYHTGTADVGHVGEKMFKPCVTSLIENALLPDSNEMQSIDSPFLSQNGSQKWSVISPSRSELSDFHQLGGSSLKGHTPTT